MLTIKLRDIQGVHPEFSRIERDLDLAPVGVPDEAPDPQGYGRAHQYALPVGRQ